MFRFKILHAGSNDLTEAVDINTEEGIETTVDTFILRLHNDGSLPLIESDDTLRIWFWDDSPDGRSETNSDIVMDGIIVEVNYTVDFDSTTVLVRGVNLLEKLLNTAVPASFTTPYSYASRQGSAAAVCYLIDEANDNNSAYFAGKGIDNITYDSSSIPNSAEDLPKDYFENYKSIYEHIETLASEEWTQDYNNLFWLDTTTTSNPKFYFLSPSASGYNTAIDTITEGTHIATMKITHAVFDVINVVIINCGYDFNGNSITTYQWDSTSVGEYGPKYKYEEQLSVAANLKTENSVTISEDHPFGNAADYSGGNTQFRLDVKERGKVEAMKIISRTANPRYKVNISMSGTLTYNKGKIYNINSDTLGWTGSSIKPIRLREVSHHFTAKQGWVTTLHLVEDEDTVLL